MIKTRYLANIIPTVCPKGHRFMQREGVATLCPYCHPNTQRKNKRAAIRKQEAQEEHQTIYPPGVMPNNGDGVYVDVSQRGGHMCLGFVLKAGGQMVEQWSTGSNNTKTVKAEREAIHVAHKRYPGVTIYSDHQGSAEALGAVYINRNKNKEAHNTAHHRKNYIGESK